MDPKLGPGSGAGSDSVEVAGQTCEGTSPQMRPSAAPCSHLWGASWQLLSPTRISRSAALSDLLNIGADMASLA